ncbi:hypothetical protein MOO44_03350 [Nicoliella spurrieriana]|uniref:Lysozyme n=1 Tax=Nicoliella spurrieriana TaxID=2925830 RepID=A0A976X5R7_9LACO|nr:GH25 family lysozyme [Nicoliella spurrieriana]UQS87208.1 hypothetical protein MOO44_03350 [Nicoliella spurrieriana]
MKKIRHVLTKAGLVLSTGIVTLGIVNVATLGKPNPTVKAAVSMNPAYDLSEWQKTMTDSQVQQLKKEASFVIIRVQYGSNYADKVYQNNIKLLDKYNVPYGVYSYSLYNSVAQAQGEAQTLYNRVPNARFYVNDLEQTNGMSTSTLNSATSAWADEMRTLTTRPIVLYSGLYFMSNTIGDAKDDYDTLWVASYGAGEPNPSYTYGLWQFTDSYHSTALNQNVDASVIPDGGKSMSFWVGSGASGSTASSSQSVSSSAASSANSVGSSIVSSASVASSSNVTSSASSSVSSASSNGSSTSSVTSSSASSSASASSTSVKSSVAASASSSTKFSDSTTNSLTTANKHSISKQKTTTIKVLKPKINTKVYHSSKNVKMVQVTAKNGIYIYDSANQRIKHLKKGAKVAVKSFKQRGTKTIAMGANGTHFTSNKSYVKAVK